MAYFMENRTCTHTFADGYFHIIYKGVHFTVDGQQRMFRGTIGLTSADNLASQLLGGYKQLSSALRRCRYCMAHRDDMCIHVCKLVCVHVHVYLL